jgi:hypothetical protein
MHIVLAFFSTDFGIYFAMDYKSFPFYQEHKIAEGIDVQETAVQMECINGW